MPPIRLALFHSATRMVFPSALAQDRPSPPHTHSPVKHSPRAAVQAHSRLSYSPTAAGGHSPIPLEAWARLWQLHRRCFSSETRPGSPPVAALLIRQFLTPLEVRYPVACLAAQYLFQLPRHP